MSKQNIEDACSRSHFHDIYIEHTERTRFRVAPKTVMTEGPLSKKWKTTLCSRVELGPEGIYVPYNLDVSPHWSAPRGKRKSISDHVLKRTSNQVRVIPKQQSFAAMGDIIALNSCHDDWNRFELLFQQYPWEHIVEELLSTSHDKSRGNLAKHRGFTSLDIKAKSNKPVTFPSFLTSTDGPSVHRMALATNIMRQVFGHFGFECPFSDSTLRTKEFSSYLCTSFGLSGKDLKGNPSNLFEFCTDAITVIPDPGSYIIAGGQRYDSPTRIKCHLDASNCPIWSAVFIMYKHLPVQGGWLRVTCIFTARKCSLDYMRRLNSYEQLRMDLVAYYNHAKERNVVTAEDLPLFPHQSNEPGLHLPSFNKLKGFHSCALTILHAAKKFFKLDLESLLEMTIPFALASSYLNPYKIVASWLASGNLPTKTGTGNLAVELLSSMTEQFGGINKNTGKTLRCIVFFNYSVTLKQIISLCKNTREVTMLINCDENPRSFSKVNQLYKAAGLLGDLSTQHLIALLSGLGVLRHGVFYLTEAIVCENTVTFKKLQEFYNLPIASINQAYKTIAQILGISTACVEQLVCEFFRDCDPAIGFSAHLYAERVQERIQGILHLRPDLRFSGQWYFDVRSNQICYEAPEEGKTTIVNYDPPVSRLIDPYVFARIPNLSMEVKVSKTSKLKGVAMTNTRKQMAKNAIPEDKKEEKRCRDESFQCHLSKRAKLELSCTRRLLRSSLGFSLYDLLGATKEDGNHTSINRVSTMLMALNNTPCKLLTPLPGRKEKPYRTDLVVTLDGRQGYSVFVQASQEWTVRQDSPSIVSFGLIGFSKNGTAVYRTAPLAMRACMARCLVDGAKHYKNMENGLPQWAASIGVLEKNSFHVLCTELGGKLNCLFGVLTQDGRKLTKLHIPSQYLSEDLDFQSCEWESFVYQDSPWRHASSAKISNALSLIGKDVKHNCGDKVMFGKVVGYHLKSKCWIVRYKDGSTTDNACEEIIKLLR